MSLTGSAGRKNAKNCIDDLQDFHFEMEWLHLRRWSCWPYRKYHQCFLRYFIGSFSCNDIEYLVSINDPPSCLCCGRDLFSLHLKTTMFRCSVGPCRAMAFRYAVRPYAAFHNIYKYKDPLKFCTPILKRSAQTQAADQNVEVKSFHEIPGPKGLPLIGSLLDYSRDLGQGVRGYQRMHVLQQQRVQQYGKIYREKILNHETVTISDPDDVEFLFRNEGKYPKREPPFPMWIKYKEDRDRVHGVGNL